MVSVWDIASSWIVIWFSETGGRNILYKREFFASKKKVTFELTASKLSFFQGCDSIVVFHLGTLDYPSYLVNLTIYGLNLPRTIKIRNVVFTVSWAWLHSLLKKIVIKKVKYHYLNYARIRVASDSYFHLIRTES